ncbi:MAG: threonine--tRNA ligase [bacterium]
MSIENKRHSLSHVLAMAVLEIYPEAKLAIGPAIDNGFYYDFDNLKISDADLEKIERHMNQLIKQNLEFEKYTMGIDEALTKEQDREQIYKMELIDDLKADGETEVSYYKLGEFEDLCAGPHLQSTNEIKDKSFKLNKLAGAYWRGSEKNKMLTRIYGLAFETRQELEEYIAMMKDAEARDHRKIGKELDLFLSSEEVGKGLPMLTPKGSVIRMELEKFVIKEEARRGYQRVFTPDIARLELYKQSGHWDHYHDSMYSPIDIDGEDYMLRPMSCPHHFIMYRSKPHSYRELPIRYAEIAKLYRKEQSGELSGLIRAMCFSLVDAHIICREDQLEDEFAKVVDLVQYGMKVLGMKDYSYRFSKWDPKNKEKYVNQPKDWDNAQKAMKNILDKMKLDYVEAEDEAAFYGPKLDVQMKNVNGKEDTLFTVQIDFYMPEKFDLTYVDKAGKEQRPFIIHRSSIGAIERVMAFLIEQYAGAFPVWLSPVQVKLISVGEGHHKYCQDLAQEFLDQEIRVEVDDSDETVGNKIRKATTEKVPYVLVIGDKEIESKNLNVRDRGGKETREISKKNFFKEVRQKIEHRN